MIDRAEGSFPRTDLATSAFQHLALRPHAWSGNLDTGGAQHCRYEQLC